MSNLNRLTKEVRRDLGNKPIWLTEFGYQTNPPDYFGVKPTTQAQYVGEAALRAYQLPGVQILIQFLVRDEPHVDRFQSGLFNVHGVAKPAVFGVPLPSRAGDAAAARGRRCGDRCGREQGRARTVCRSARRTAAGAGSAAYSTRMQRESSRGP